MRTYLDLMNKILTEGVPSDDRTGTGTLSIFGTQMRFDLTEGFPLLTTKRLNIDNIVHELLWFISGDTNISYLKENNCNIWNEWADDHGDLGPVYGAQWRSWEMTDSSNGGYIDQLSELILGLKTDPYGRRHLMSAWNVNDINKMALPPCHLLVQFYVRDKTLSCQLYQRSGDIFLGIPYNIASYALLTHMIAQVCGYAVGEFIHVGGDMHLYHNHITQAKQQLTRQPLSLPKLLLNPEITHIDDFQRNDVQLSGYHAHRHIKAPVAI